MSTPNIPNLRLVAQRHRRLRHERPLAVVGHVAHAHVVPPHLHRRRRRRPAQRRPAGRAGDEAVRLIPARIHRLRPRCRHRRCPWAWPPPRGPPCPPSGRNGGLAAAAERPRGEAVHGHCLAGGAHDDARPAPLEVPWCRDRGRSQKAARRGRRAADAHRRGSPMRRPRPMGPARLWPADNGALAEPPSRQPSHAPRSPPSTHGKKHDPW